MGSRTHPCPARPRAPPCPPRTAPTAPAACRTQSSAAGRPRPPPPPPRPRPRTPPRRRCPPRRRRCRRHSRRSCPWRTTRRRRCRPPRRPRRRRRRRRAGTSAPRRCPSCSAAVPGPRCGPPGPLPPARPPPRPRTARRPCPCPSAPGRARCARRPSPRRAARAPRRRPAPACVRVGVRVHVRLLLRRRPSPRGRGSNAVQAASHHGIRSAGPGVRSPAVPRASMRAVWAGKGHITRLLDQVPQGCGRGAGEALLRERLELLRHVALRVLRVNRHPALGQQRDQHGSPGAVHGGDDVKAHGALIQREVARGAAVDGRRAGLQGLHHLTQRPLRHCAAPVLPAAAARASWAVMVELGKAVVTGAGLQLVLLGRSPQGDLHARGKALVAEQRARTERQFVLMADVDESRVCARVPCARGSRLSFSWGVGNELRLIELRPPATGGPEQQQRRADDDEDDDAEDPFQSSVLWCGHFELAGGGTARVADLRISGVGALDHQRVRSLTRNAGARRRQRTGRWPRPCCRSRRRWPSCTRPTRRRSLVRGPKQQPEQLPPNVLSSSQGRRRVTAQAARRAPGSWASTARASAPSCSSKGDCIG